MGRLLLADVGLDLDSVTHRNFNDLHKQIDEKGEEYFQLAKADISSALVSLYGETAVSMQQLSATFRRGDLIEIPKKIKAQKPIGLLVGYYSTCLSRFFCEFMYFGNDFGGVLRCLF